MKFLFILFYLVFFVGLAVFKKSEKRINVARYLVFQVILVMIFNVILAAVLFIFEVGLIPMLIAGILGIIGIILITLSVKRKTVQKYEFKLVDFFAVLFIAVIAIVVGTTLFGEDLHLAYYNADPAAHFYMAQNNLINKEHSGMFFNEVNNALMINGLGIFTKTSFSNYKIYLVIEIGMLALSGLMFYVLVADFAKNSKWRCGICAVIAVLYMLGYSLNNVIFGFGYLGVSVTLICFSVYACKKFWDGLIHLRVFIPLISMCMLSVALCYMLFAPMIWVLVAAIMLAYCKKKKIALKQTLILEFSIFIVPLLLAIKFCYFEFFLATNLNMSDQLRAAGMAYENYGSNFIVLMPAGLYAVLQNIKKKKHFVTTFFFLGWLAFVILAVIVEKLDLMSPYYCLKTYYTMWLMAFVVFTDGIMQIMNRNAKIAILYIGGIVVFVIGAFFWKGNLLVDIYERNFDWLELNDVIGNETMVAYRYATDEIVNKGEKITWVTNISQYGRAFWFYSIQAMIANDCNYCQPWNYNEEELREVMKKEGVKYAGIYKFAPESYEPYKNILKHGIIVFETSEVAIYKL